MRIQRGSVPPNSRCAALSCSILRARGMAVRATFRLARRRVGEHPQCLPKAKLIARRRTQRTQCRRGHRHRQARRGRCLQWRGIFQRDQEPVRDGQVRGGRAGRGVGVSNEARGSIGEPSERLRRGLFRTLRRALRGRNPHRAARRVDRRLRRGAPGPRLSARAKRPARRVQRQAHAACITPSASANTLGGARIF